MFGKDWRGYLLNLHWQTARAIAPRRTVESRGLRFSLGCDNRITHYRWRTYNSKEPQTLDWIDTWVRDGDVVFDIGANVGVYTLYIALRHPGARVIAFEPEYANLHLLRDNIMNNGLQDRIEVYSMALSNRCGLSQLHIQDTTPGAALHTESPAPLQTTLTHHPVVWREGIYSITIDQWCQETGLWPNAIKIDVDGTEDRILEGAARALHSRAMRSIIFEPPDNEQARQACLRLLTIAGLERVELNTLTESPNEIWVRRDATR